MMSLNYLANIGRFVPEMIACATMFGLILIEATHDRSDENRGLFYAAAIGGLAVAFFYLLDHTSLPAQSIFTKSLIIDPFSTIAKAIMVLATIGSIYLAFNSNDIYPRLKARFSNTRHRYFSRRHALSFCKQYVDSLYRYRDSFDPFICYGIT